MFELKRLRYEYFKIILLSKFIRPIHGLGIYRWLFYQNKWKYPGYALTRNVFAFLIYKFKISYDAQICRSSVSNSDVPKLIVYFPLLNDKRGTQMSGIDCCIKNIDMRESLLIIYLYILYIFVYLFYMYSVFLGYTTQLIEISYIKNDQVLLSIPWKSGFPTNISDFIFGSAAFSIWAQSHWKMFVFRLRLESDPAKFSNQWHHIQPSCTKLKQLSSLMIFMWHIWGSYYISYLCWDP